MSYIATILDVTQPDGMPLWESPEQPTAKSAYDLAENHIHRSQPDDVIAPIDDWGEYAVWNQTEGVRSTRVATLTITADDRHAAPGRATRAWSVAATAVTTGAANTSVLAISFTAHGVLEFITVRDDQGARTHATGWDERDEILFDPRTAAAARRRPGATTMTAPTPSGRPAGQRLRPRRPGGPVPDLQRPQPPRRSWSRRPSTRPPSSGSTTAACNTTPACSPPRCCAPARSTRQPAPA